METQDPLDPLEQPANLDQVDIAEELDPLEKPANLE
jgi:hypothetical protein